MTSARSEPAAFPQPRQVPPQSVPAHLWFIWFGSTLPLFAEIALRSAARHNPGARVTLLHANLSPSEQARLSTAWLELRSLDIESLVEAAVRRASSAEQAPLDRQRLLFVWKQLTKPAARANLARLLVLYAEGGVYLDTDTLTLRDFAPLLELGAFCGQEQILWPRRQLGKRRAYFWLKGPALSLLRLSFAVVPKGYRAQRSLSSQYSLAVNNAVLGCSAGHSRINAALQLACSTPDHELTRPYRLGTHLLQTVLDSPPSVADEVVLLAPEYFYPLGPVISHHYFRATTDVAAVTKELLFPNTYVVHWYASVSNLLKLDAAHILEQRHRTPFAHLCAPYVDEREPSANEPARS